MRVDEIFHRLGFKTQTLENETLLAFVPLARFDVNEEIDLVEEAARIHGYNKLDKPAPLFSSSEIPQDPLFLFERKIRTKWLDSACRSGSLAISSAQSSPNLRSKRGSLKSSF